MVLPVDGPSMMCFRCVFDVFDGRFCMAYDANRFIDCLSIPELTLKPFKKALCHLAKHLTDKCCCFSLWNTDISAFCSVWPWLCLAHGFLDLGLVGLEALPFQDLDLS